MSKLQKYNRDETKEINKNRALCKYCVTHVGYASGNTSNLMPHTPTSTRQNPAGTMNVQSEHALPTIYQETFTNSMGIHSEIFAVIYSCQ